MKTSVKGKAKRGAARDLFAELSEGMEALADARHGKRTLRTHALEYKPAPSITPQELAHVHSSRSICGRTFAHWKTGNRGEPSRTRKQPY